MGNFEIYNMRIFKSKNLESLFIINRFGANINIDGLITILRIYFYTFILNPILDLNISEKF